MVPERSRELRPARRPRRAQHPRDPVAARMDEGEERGGRGVRPAGVHLLAGHARPARLRGGGVPQPQLLLLDEVHEALDHEFRALVEERARHRSWPPGGSWWPPATTTSCSAVSAVARSGWRAEQCARTAPSRRSWPRTWARERRRLARAGSPGQSRRRCRDGAAGPAASAEGGLHVGQDGALGARGHHGLGQAVHVHVGAPPVAALSSPRAAPARRPYRRARTCRSRGAPCAGRAWP